MDMCYSLALHMLVLISQSDVPLSSARIADSTGANASQIRKIAARLNQSGIVKSRKGAAGFHLAKNPADITLLDVYRSVYQCDKVQLLTMHRNPNDRCAVGRYIRPVLTSVFGAAEASAARTMSETTIADLTDQVCAAAENEKNNVTRPDK